MAAGGTHPDDEDVTTFTSERGKAIEARALSVAATEPADLGHQECDAPEPAPARKGRAVRHLFLRVPPGKLGLILRFPKDGKPGRRPYVIDILSSCPIKAHLRIGDQLLSIGGQQIAAVEQLLIGSDIERELVFARDLPLSVAQSDGDLEEAFEGFAKALCMRCIDQCITGRNQIRNVLDHYKEKLTVDLIQGKMVTASRPYHRGKPLDLIHRCTVAGCSREVVQKGRKCLVHGGVASLAAPGLRKCRIEGCLNTERADGLCLRHGGRLTRGEARIKVCRHEGCTKVAQVGGVCVRHGARKKLCRVEGCTNQVQNRGLCKRHGAKVRVCTHEGCAKQVERGGFCVRHGAQRGIQHGGRKREREDEEEEVSEDLAR